MNVCLLCNGLAAIEKKCPACGCEMLDAGLLQDYYDNYSAYLEQDIYEDGYRSYDEAHCVHLFTCPHCHFDMSFVIDRVDEDFLIN